VIVIEKWSGLVTNASPYALPGGACVSQVNMQCLRPGQLQCRQGMVTASAVSGTVLSVVRLSAGTTERVVCQAGTAIVISALT